MNIQQYKTILKAYVTYLKEQRDDSREIPALESEYNEAVSVAIRYLQKNVRNDSFNLDEMGSSTQEIRERQKNNIILLHQFLDQAIDRNTPPRFLEQAAPGIQAAVIDPALKIEDQLYIYDEPQKLGIREKYVRGTLSDKHGLTDLDVRRMLELTDCSNRVSVLPLSVEGIKAALDSLKDNIAKKTDVERLIKDEDENYTIPFIIKYPSDGVSGEPYWFTATVSYNANSGELSYQVTGLPKEKHDACKETIEAALTSSFPDKVVNREKTSITEPDVVREPHLSGYYALHNLFKNREIQRGDETALAYADVDSSDPKNLIKKFFEIELTDLSLPIDIYHAFAQNDQFKKPIVDRPTHVVVDETRLESFLTTLQAQAVLTPQIPEKEVSDGVGAYSADLDFLSFPSVKSERLDTIQYYTYFSDLSEILKGRTLPTMRLNHCNEHALKGLNSFLAISEATPFAALQINVSLDAEAKPAFIKNLQLALKNLSRNGLTKLELVDDQNRLTAEHYEQLLKFVLAEEIAIKIDLPEALKKSDLQRKFDQLTAVNIRHKNNDSLQSTLSQEKSEAQQNIGKKVRERGPEISFEEVTVDLEVAATISETVVIKPTQVRQRRLKEYGGFQKFTLSDLSSAISSTEPNAFTKFESIAGGLSKAEFVKYWHSLSSNITIGPLKLGEASAKFTVKNSQVLGKQVVYINPQFNGFTTDAFARLVQFKEYFSGTDGINVDQLPAGFILIPDPDDPQTTLLHYDSNNEDKGLLIPQLVEKKSNEILSIDVTDKLLAGDSVPVSLKEVWHALQTGEYSRKKSELFRQYLPELLGLTSEQLITVIALCGGVEAFKYNNLDFIFKNLDRAKSAYATPYDETALVSIKWMEAHFPDSADREKFVKLANEITPHKVELHALFLLLDQDGATGLKKALVQAAKDYELTDKELNGLLRLYDKYGTGGLEKLLSKWSSINHFVPLNKLPAITKNIADYEKLLVSDDVLQAVKAISEFDKNKRQWWDRLYSAHTPKEDDFLTVYKSFTNFIQVVEQYKLTFYDLSTKDSASLFVGAGNLPATVGRMLSILNSCNPHDRELQWGAMSEINIASKGALRAITYTKTQKSDRLCGFVLPEMEFGPKSPLGDGLYDPVIGYKSIANPDDPKDQMKAFYSCLAYQNHRLPLAFYKEALTKIDEIFLKDELTPQARKQLYALLVASTTGDNYRFYIDNPKVAMEQWLSILKEIQNVKIDRIVSAVTSTKEIRETAVEQLFELRQIPALPVLERLTKLSMAPFHEITVTKINAVRIKKDKLVECNERLQTLLKEYGDIVYQGMKFYTDSDYQIERPAEKSLFEHHLEVSEALHKEKIGKLLLEQVSSFHINPSDVSALAKAFNFSLGKKIFTRVYPQNHSNAGQPIIQADAPKDLGVARTLFAIDKYLIEYKDKAGANLHLRYLYPDEHPKKGKELPEAIKAELKAIRVYPEGHPRQGKEITIPESINAVLKSISVYPEGHPRSGQEITIPESINALLKQVYLYPDDHEDAGKIIPNGTDLSTLKDPITAWVYVYPEGHGRQGERIDEQLIRDKESEHVVPVVAVLKEVYFYPEDYAEVEKAGTQVPADQLPLEGSVVKIAYCDPLNGKVIAEGGIFSDVVKPSEAWVYVYPEGHHLSGKKVTEQVIRDRQQAPAAPVVSVLKEVYFYPDDHPKKAKQQVLDGEQRPDDAVAKLAYCYPDGHEKQGQVIPTDTGIFSGELSATDAWVYVYPEEHERAGQVVDGLAIIRDKEQAPPAPVYGVLREVYFYPKGHEKENTQVPFTEKQPVGALLKVAYCHPETGEILEGKLFEVKKANAHFIFPKDHERAGQESGKTELVELRTPTVYPEGHPKAGQVCDFYMQTVSRETTTSYEENLFSQDLFKYASYLLRDIESIKKPGENGNLAAEDLKQFIFAFGDKIDELFLEMDQEVAVAYVEFAKKCAEKKEEQGKLALRAGEGGMSGEDFMKWVEENELYLQMYPSLNTVYEEVYDKNRKKYQDQILNFVEARLGAHFAKGYFAKKRAGDPSPQVRLLIERAFIDGNIKESVESIRLLFDKKSTEQQQINMVTLFDAICTELSHSNQLQLFKFLTQANLTEASIDDYLALLNAINEKGASSFMYFIQNAQKFPKPVSNLAEKATFFLQKALPHIRHRENVLTDESDLMDLAIDVVLAANTDELRAEYKDIKPELINAYVQLNEKLGTYNGGQIEEAIEHLALYNPVVDSIEGMSELKEHLRWLKTEERERYEITPEKREKVKVEKRGAGNSFARGFGGLFGIKTLESSGYEEREVVTQAAVMGERVKNKELNRVLVDKVKGSLVPLIKEVSSYTYAFAETFALINGLVTAYPGAKAQILEHCRHYLSFNTTDGSQIMEAFTNIGKLDREFKALKDQNLVIGLCENFGSVKKDQELLKDFPYNYQDLLNIFKGKEPFENYPKLNSDAKKQILVVINSLLNNKKSCTLENIKHLIDQCAHPENGTLYQKTLETVFANAPFPSFTKLNQWVTDATKPPVNPVEAIKQIEKEYSDWSREPVQRETTANGFNLVHAQKQNKLMQGFKYEDSDLEKINKAVNGTKDEGGVRHLDTKEILDEIDAIRKSEVLQKQHRADPTRLVALMAELLYRTKGLEAIPRELGRSFEINTTQYLAIHSMLKTGGHVTSQIGTGEGKSRIMMISIACQYALGNTVDFVTADVSLATRDYLEYQSFFKAMKAETRLITADMPAEQYKIGGIHFSDPTNLSLFRNKARSEGRWEEVIDPRKDKRALMLDEADKVFFDCSDRRFNYSAQANPNTRDMEWIYELLVEFFSQDKNKALYKRDADACNEAFINFARGPLANYPERMARLEYNKKIPMPVISRNQLESWQKSALTALNLKLGDKFTIIPNVSIKTKEGQTFVSQAQLRSSEGRAAGAAKMSFGVHQCLHARLNMVRDKRLPNDPLTESGLDQLKYPFYLDPETQIVYSSSSKSMLVDYSEGELLAVTGTGGGIREKEEAEKAFGQSGSKMTFIDMPRHRDPQRIDRPFLLANNHDDHEKKILKAVLNALDKNQPILLVCENDNESKRILEFLEINLTDKQKEKLKRISAETELKVEAEHVEKHAGQPGAITVSTAMLGRGTDIKLFGAAKTHGLHVIGTYLPRERDYWQIVGRAGRFGAQGETEFILDKERTVTSMKEFLGLDTIPIQFYTATEDYLKMLQEKMDSKAQKYRLIKDVANDYRQELMHRFFDDFKKNLPEGNNTDEILGPWQQFFDKSDKFWNEMFPKIQAALEEKPINVNTINTELKKYQDNLQTDWGAMRADFEAKIESGKIKTLNGKEYVAEKLAFNVKELKLPENIMDWLSDDNSQKRVLKTRIANNYDPAYVGRAVIYENIGDGLKAFFKNIAAAWRGDGPWFPNLKAAQNGNMSWSQLFFGTWGSPLAEAQPKKIDSAKIESTEEEQQQDPMNRSPLLLSGTFKVEPSSKSSTVSDNPEPLSLVGKHSEGSVLTAGSKQGAHKDGQLMEDTPLEQQSLGQEKR
jgi:hypothetical protein